MCDWYQNSITDTVPPVWTDEHLEELLKDFIVIPKDTPTAEVEEVKHGEWIGDNGNMAYDDYRCSCCGNYTNTRNQFLLGLYCSFCGAKMDGRSDT